MEVRASIAVVLMAVSIAGAEERYTALALDDAGRDSSEIVREAGPAGGTILPAQERGGFVALGARQPIELRRPYRGGYIGDYL
jgi:hypothetical protein